ncbi:EF-P lysine aminoacylase GenX [Beijerinckiaceae bacterium RH AL1]|nr:EF-P lysine aminoacylase EpmA [Beijerinckiaceae bacterium]VVB47240.1 EF-P lysine aminoacylase GenX [Beijerinckiaceae bacterium RH CH11]VVB47323.1 EF-P lysine aminoacylase GenX [Beijerinckiaceae bacterium RH AL8]VVC55786.1 EF-P lysine aminoacylase GenX [Beijerinckiaceae bacterium RH AL1]
MMRPSPWWRPDVFAARRPALAARGRLAAAIRADFAAAGLVEVDTPALQVSPGNETHISAFATAMLGDTPRPMYLHSSPEFACKKLLAAGAGDLFTFAHAFRNRERGRLHHPEFTMLEWYRVGGSLDLLMRDAAGILGLAGEIAQDGLLRHRDAVVEAAAEPEILTVVEAFRRHAALDLESLLPDQPDAVTRLADATRARGLRVAADDTWSDLFSKLVTALVEPKLGHGRATFLTRYPASEAALARLCPDDPRFADRFELYVCGVELANAFHELADPAEQRRRFMQAEAERARIYGETYPIDEDFLAALEIMPEACGIALGFDRLVMLATGAEHIEDVLWAPVA